jgi:hypothetical protein
VPCDRGLLVADLDADALGNVRGSQGAGDGLTNGAERAPGGAAHRVIADGRTRSELAEILSSWFRYFPSASRRIGNRSFVRGYTISWAPATG